MKEDDEQIDLDKAMKQVEQEYSSNHTSKLCLE